MLDLNEKLYEELLAGDKPLLVEYWAPWCVYCRRIAPAMKQLSDRREDLVVAQVNIDDHPELAKQEQIEVIPTLVLYKGGQAVASIVAPESKALIDELILKNL